MERFELIMAKTQLPILIVSPSINLVVGCQSQAVLSSAGHKAYLLVVLTTLIKGLNWYMNDITLALIDSTLPM